MACSEEYVVGLVISFWCVQVAQVAFFSTLMCGV